MVIVVGLLIATISLLEATGASWFIFILGAAIVTVSARIFLEGISRPRRFAETFGMNPPPFQEIPKLDSVCCGAVERTLTERAITLHQLFQFETMLQTQGLTVADLESQRQKLAEVRKEIERARAAFWTAHNLADSYNPSSGYRFPIGKSYKYHLPGEKLAASSTKKPGSGARVAS